MASEGGLSDKIQSRSGNNGKKRYAPRTKTGCLTCRYEAASGSFCQVQLMVVLESVVSNVTKLVYHVSGARPQGASVTDMPTIPKRGMVKLHVVAWR